MGVVKRVRMKVEDYFKLPKMANRDKATNKEKLDPVPMAPPIGWFKQPSMFDQVRQMVASEHMRLFAESQGAETFEESQDFDVDDELFPESMYEGDFDALESLEARRQADYRRGWMEERQNREMRADVKRWREEGQPSPDSPNASSGARSAAPGAAEKGESRPQAGDAPRP